MKRRKPPKQIPPVYPVSGGNGNDTAVGGDGDDSITGNSGDDDLSGELGDDSIDGGDGVDSAAWRGRRRQPEGRRR